MDKIFKSKIISIENDLNKIKSWIRNFEPTSSKYKEIDLRETLCIFIYTVSMFKIGEFFFPIKIENCESPDFIINDCKENHIGIEHTRATVQTYKMALNELNKKEDGSCLELSRYLPSRKLEKKDAFSGIRNPDEELNDLPMIGNEPEIDWAKIIISSIFQKLEILNSKHFRIFPTNELIIEDNTPVDFVIDLDVGITELRKNVECFKIDTFENKFDKIHLFSQNTLIVDLFGRFQIMDVSKKNI